MNPVLIVLAALAGSVVVGLGLARVLVRAQSPVLSPPDLRPGADRTLAMVVRANQGLGAWMADGAGVRSAAAGRLAPAQEEVIRARLDRLGRSAGQGTELLEQGTLVFTADGTRVGAILLPGAVPQAALESARQDLAHLVEELRQRPVLAAIGREQERPGESPESIAMRLAHQLERMLDTDVAVALVRPVGVQVLGISLRSDPRMLHALAAEGSAMERVARGIEAGPAASDDPLGRGAGGRRRHLPPAVVVPLAGGEFPIGAVSLWTAGAKLPTGEVLADLQAALLRAAPRLAGALERFELQESAATDPLTGLRNRRGLDSVLRRHDQREGAMIYADLDHFKALNDTLGHAAGDAALVHFTRLVAQRIRTRDTAARIGGEEFALWLPGATLLEGTEVAERIRVALEETPWAWQGRP